MRETRTLLSRELSCCGIIEWSSLKVLNWGRTPERGRFSAVYLMDEFTKSVAIEGPSPSQEVRCAVRFPLNLPVVISTGASEYSAMTSNVSASGVLFQMNSALEVGEGIDFALRMPGSVLGTPKDVLVHCHGRVVRCSMSQSQTQVAATIDEYQFVEQ